MKGCQKTFKKKPYNLFLGFSIEIYQELIAIVCGNSEIILIFKNTNLKNSKNILVFFRLKKNLSHKTKNRLKFYTGYIGILKNGTLYKLARNFFSDHNRWFVILRKLKNLNKRCEFEIKLTSNDYLWIKSYCVNFLVFFINYIYI